ncbi:MAG TPA: F0F1 ATP synthase subunit alpha, partial [Phycisphaerales bacterium]|nr:F0F1 ATP synthase subunit alpha [Phycisphaerales bacterium]
FAQLGTELDKATQRQLDRGARMVELLKQPQFRPMEVIDQVISIFAASKGLMDDLPVTSVAQFEKGLLEYMRGLGKSVRDELSTKRDIKAVEKPLMDAIAAFKSTFKAK